MRLKRRKRIKVEHKPFTVSSFTAQGQVAGPALGVVLGGSRGLNYMTLKSQT